MKSYKIVMARIQLTQVFKLKTKDCFLFRGRCTECYSILASGGFKNRTLGRLISLLLVSSSSLFLLLPPFLLSFLHSWLKFIGRAPFTTRKSGIRPPPISTGCFKAGTNVNLVPVLQHSAPRSHLVPGHISTRY